MSDLIHLSIIHLKNKKYDKQIIGNRSKSGMKLPY